MASVVRTVVYLAVIVGLVVVFVPARDPRTVRCVSPMSVGHRPVWRGDAHLAGVGLALWCALTFAVIGRGTPLPFDPPGYW